MKQYLLVGILSGVFSIILLPQPPQTVTYDAGKDFSLSSNTGKTWQYGYSRSNSLAPDQFQLYTFSETIDEIGFWHPAKSEGNGPGYYPYAAFNLSSKSQIGSKGWAIRAGEIAMEASNSGQFSLIRFVAPVKGNFRVAAQFEGIHFSLSSTDVHVLRNDAPLFESEIEGYGGDPAFHKIEGTHPTASYAGTVQLEAGDTITFAVGYGRNKTHFNDTTGLSATVTQVFPARR